MIWISAIAVIISICAGVAIYMGAMINAFNKLEKSGAADPSQLAGDISTALVGGMLAIPFACASLILFIIALVRHRKFSNPAQAC